MKRPTDYLQTHVGPIMVYGIVCCSNSNFNMSICIMVHQPFFSALGRWSNSCTVVLSPTCTKYLHTLAGRMYNIIFEKPNLSSTWFMMIYLFMPFQTFPRESFNLFHPNLGPRPPLCDRGLWPRVTWTPWTARGWCWCKARATSWAPRSRRSHVGRMKDERWYNDERWMKNWNLVFLIGNFLQFGRSEVWRIKISIWHLCWDTCWRVASIYHLFRCRHCKKGKPQQSNRPGVYPGDLQCSGRDLRYRREPRSNNKDQRCYRWWHWKSQKSNSKSSVSSDSHPMMASVQLPAEGPGHRAHWCAARWRMAQPTGACLSFQNILKRSIWTDWSWPQFLVTGLFRSFFLFRFMKRTEYKYLKNLKKLVPLYSPFPTMI